MFGGHVEADETLIGIGVQVRAQGFGPAVDVAVGRIVVRTFKDGVFGKMGETDLTRLLVARTPGKGERRRYYFSVRDINAVHGQAV